MRIDKDPRVREAVETRIPGRGTYRVGLRLSTHKVQPSYGNTLLDTVGQVFDIVSATDLLLRRWLTFATSALVPKTENAGTRKC